MGTMRVDFALNDEEVLTATVFQQGDTFIAFCDNMLSTQGSTAGEALEKLRGGVRRHFLKLRCKSALAYARTTGDYDAPLDPWLN